MLLIWAIVTVGLLAAEGPGLLAAVEASDRTDSWEFVLPIRYFGGETLDFDHGTKVDINDDLGWGFGFGYNFNEHMNLNFEFSWLDANYRVDFADADPPPFDTDSASATGDLEVSSSTFNFTYNFMPKTVTPYVSAALGWNWFDTNIPTGPPSTGCWWDPWYGYICTSYQDTASDSGFVYGFGAGVRLEVKDSFYLRFGLNDNWLDLGSYSSSSDILTYRLDMGWKF
jgi:opacity protein-like surface antigen